MNTAEHSQMTRKAGGSSWYRICSWGAILIIAYFLVTEHRAHVIAFLPYAFLLACPLMHIFMHRGHHEHNGHSKQHNSVGVQEKT